MDCNMNNDDLLKKNERLSVELDNINRKAANLRLIADYTSNWEVLAEKSGDIRLLTGGYETISGYKRDEITNHIDFLRTIVYEKDRESLDRHLKGCEDMSFAELRIVNKDGNTRWITHTCIPVKENDGQIAAYRFSIQDITERKNALRELAQSEALHRVTLSNISDAVFVTKDNGIFTFVCPNAHVIFGFSSKEVEQMKNISALLGSGFYDYDELLLKKELPNIELTIQDKFQREHVLLTNVKRVVLGEGSVLITCRDITERKKAENALGFSEEKFERLVQSIEDIVFTINETGIFTGLYGKWLSSYNLNPDTYIGKHLSTFFTEQNDFQRSSAMRNALEGNPAVFNLTANIDGKTHIFETSISVLSGAGGESLGLVAVARDITEQQEFKEELKKSRNELMNLTAHLQNVREEERAFVAREIHDDLGQALTALKIDISRLQDDCRTDQKIIKDKLDGMLRLTDSIIQTVKRISTRLRPGILDALGLSSAIEWQASEFEERTGIHCNLDIDNVEKDIDESISITVFRIFQEIITNVIRHAEADNVDVILRFTEKELTLDITDNGIGIKKEEIESPRSLGIIGIRERVRKWSGKVEFINNNDKGTQIRITIPLS